MGRYAAGTRAWCLTTLHPMARYRRRAAHSAVHGGVISTPSKLSKLGFEGFEGAGGCAAAGCAFRSSVISLAAQLVFMDTRAIRSRVFVAIERTTLSLIFVWTGDKLYKLIRTSRAAPTITGEGSPAPQPALTQPIAPKRGSPPASVTQMRECFMSLRAETCSRFT
jgi:hypothetical protein